MSKSASISATSVIPAQLAFIAIYNPSLGGSTEDNLEDQIVYYLHRNRFRRKRRKDPNVEHAEGNEEKNERLRQVGLAQGMVQFARSFSDGQAVDSVETEKCRIILHELEPEWWILVSIDLTRLPLASNNSNATPHHPGKNESPQRYEYSAREVSPSVLLLQQLLKAHSIFLLHHGRCLDEIYGRLGRPQFCRVLDRFWTQFARRWDVLLHGNPSLEVYRGTKLAAGGELGMGVGEEEWGSGEREVLEGFVQRTEGLVDLVVSRYGDPQADQDRKAEQRVLKGPKSPRPQQGPSDLTSEPELSQSDGLIFSGTGALTSESVREIAGWMEWLHMYGEDAYGVRENPNSTSRRGGINNPTQKSEIPFRSRAANRDELEGSLRVNGPPGIRVHGLKGNLMSESIPEEQANSGPASMSVTAVNDDPGQLSVQDGINPNGDAKASLPEEVPSTAGTTTFMKYLTLGYSSNWGVSSKPKDGGKTEAHGGHKMGLESSRDNQSQRQANQAPKSTGENVAPSRPASIGWFIIGLQGLLEHENGKEDDSDLSRDESEYESEAEERHGRIHLRTINVNLAKSDQPGMNGDETLQGAASDQGVPSVNSSSESDTKSSGSSIQKLRVIVYKVGPRYTNPPFIFTFLFRLQTPALAFPTFYRSLHQQLKPLHRPLLASTSPEKVAERIMNSSSLYAKTAKASEPVYDLIFDPRTLTVHSTIPNIPEPSAPAAEASSARVHPWTRLEALNVHTQILNTFASTRHRWAELEHTCKTSRGWWVVWMRLPDLGNDSNDTRASGDNDIDELKQHQQQHREAFLIRKSSDQRPAQRNASNPSSLAVGWAPGKLAEGIGIDTKKYIEGLWSLNR